VFCEKPVSQEERGIVACYEQAEKVNKPLFCSFNRFVHCWPTFSFSLSL